MSNKLVTFFKKLGSGMKKVLGFVATLATDAQVETALTWVREANRQAVDNQRRREFAVARVQSTLKVPESLARWLVETAVQLEKKHAGVGLDKLEDVLKDDDDAPTDPPAVGEPQTITPVPGKHETVAPASVAAKVKPPKPAKGLQP